MKGGSAAGEAQASHERGHDKSTGGFPNKVPKEKVMPRNAEGATVLGRDQPEKTAAAG